MAAWFREKTRSICKSALQCWSGSDFPGDETQAHYFPPEVMEKVISHCQPPVLLKLRLVSPTMKNLVDASPQFKELIDNLEVRLNVSTLGKFLTSAPLSLPFRRFFIDLNGPCTLTPQCYRCDGLTHHNVPNFYVDSPHLQTFKQKFSPTIKTLRLSTFFCGTTDAELDFLESLEVLERLDIKRIHLNNSGCRPKERAVLGLKSPQIPNIRKLKDLSVQEYESSYSRYHEYLEGWIKQTPSLVYLKIPREMDHWPPDPFVLESQGHLPNLQRLHLNSTDLWRGWTFPMFLNELMTSRKNFRLEGVPAEVISKVKESRHLPFEAKEAFFSAVVSAVGIGGHLVALDLENLEELEFGKRFEINYYNPYPAPPDIEMRMNGGHVRLPGLKKITFRVDGFSDMSQSQGRVLQDFVERVFRPPQPRLSVTHLDIGFDDNNKRQGHFLSFTPEHLRMGFPNLTKLQLRLPCFTPDLIQVVSEKQFLEELYLCSIYNGFPEVAFTATPDDLGFRKLKNLKKLRLDTQSHPEETAVTMGDGILQVLSQMTLTHLHISGTGWTDVTGKGLSGLIEGPLGSSILWTQLKGVGAFMKKNKRQEILKRLSRVCHSNRFANGFTSLTFKQFQTSEATFLGTKYPFRRSDWIETELGPCLYLRRFL